MPRGLETETTKKIINDYTGGDVNPKRVLRLLPYIQYTVMNSGTFDRDKIDTIELSILDFFECIGVIEVEGLSIKVTKGFWEFMNEVLFESHVERVQTDE